MMKNKTFVAGVAALFAALLFCCPAVASDYGEVSRLMEAADSLHAMGRTDSAIVVAGRASDVARGSGRPQLVLAVNSSMGVYLRSAGRVDEALRCYDAALKIVTDSAFRAHPDDEDCENAAALYINLATLHLDMSHKEEAARYARTCAEWVKRCADRAFQAQVYGAIGSVLTAAGLPEEALPHQALSYERALEAGDGNSALRAAAYGMLTCDRLDRFGEADAWRRKCRELMTRELTTMTRLVYFQAECSISIRRERPRESIVWFDSILALDGIRSLPFVVYDCYNNMHLAYADLAQYDSAYATLLKSNALRDSLFEEQKAESLRELTVKYDAKEKELALARSEAAQAGIRYRLAVTWTVALAALAVVVVLFVLYAMRQRRRRYERYVEGLENERVRMARELHDGVCNDLTAIRMQLGGESAASPALGLLDACRDQVRRISHELMPPEFTHASIDEVLRYYVHKSGKAQPACRFTYMSQPADADWQRVPDATSLELYRIVQEAVGNAMKHAAATDIRVSLTRTESGLQLCIADNGTARTAPSAGIGLRTMRQRAASVGGRLDVEQGAAGTTVRLTLEL